MHFARTLRIVSGALGLLIVCGCLLVGSARAQSPDITAPSAVRTNQVTGTIAARDLGDARLTDHFFAFTGTPGDLLITVESSNLNGDIDVFTLAGMRPLLKFSVYEGSPAVISKSIYLRKRENLILRVEARTPNDDDGTYRVKFGGSFEPIAGVESEPQVTASEIASATAPGAKSGKRGTRVSSAGARIYEPPPVEVAAAPTPEPELAEKPAPGVTASRPGSRNARGRRPARGRTRPVEAKPPEENPTAETREEPTAATPANEARPAAGRRRPGRRRSTPRTVEKPPTAPEPESGPRLIIETSDGTFIDRYMSSVRRVTVENGQVVVIGKDGKIQRIPLASVVRMSIAP